MRIPNPWARLICEGEKRVLNTQDRPKEEWIGHGLTVMADGDLIGKVTITGYWDEGVDRIEEDAFGTRRHIFGEGYHMEKDAHRVAPADTIEDPFCISEREWWSDRTDVGWTLA